MALALFTPSWHLDKGNKAETYNKRQHACFIVFPVSSALRQKINVSADQQLWLKNSVDLGEAWGAADIILEWN